MIVKADDSDNGWDEVSIPSKYHSYIPPVSLTKGEYILRISPMTDFEYEDAEIIKFGLDFLYERENITEQEF